MMMLRSSLTSVRAFMRPTSSGSASREFSERCRSEREERLAKLTGRRLIWFLVTSSTDRLRRFEIP